MSTINPVLLYGPTGQPISSGRRFLHAASNPPSVEPWATVYEDPAKSVRPADRQFVVSSARKLYANLGFIREAIDGKALASFGNAFLPKWTGKSPWGKIAQDWLRNEWCSNPEIRGEMDWATLKFLESTNVDHSGDVGILLTYKGDPKRPWPRLQMVAAHRIAMRNAPTREGIIQGDECTGAAAYKGRKFEDGVIFGDYGDPVAYALIGETPEQDQIVSARSLILIKEPALGSARSLPAFFHGIMEARSVMTTQEREAFATVIASSIALMENNESGGPENVPTSLDDPLATTSAGSSGSDLRVQTYLGGLVRYFKSGTGSKLESFKTDRPGEAWESFQNRLIKMACAPVWPDELCWNMGKISGPGVRAVQGKARRFVTDRQALIAGVSLRQIQFALAIAIKTGRIPAPDTRDWSRSWDFVRPPRITIDDGRDGAARLNDYFAGITNLSDILEGEGKELEGHLYQRAWDIVTEERIRREVSVEAGIEGWEIPAERMARAVGSAANSPAASTQPAKETPDENDPEDDNDPEDTEENEE